MEVIVRRSFQKELRKVPSHIQRKVGDVISILEKSDTLDKSGVDYKKMTGQEKHEKYYHIRVGDWRIGTELKKPSIIFITILHRSEIYQRFP